MPFGGNDWLALTQEPTLGAGAAHLRSPSSLLGPSHRSASPTSGICCTSWPPTCTAATTCASTVFIEARAMYRADGPEEMRPVGEVEFVQGLAAASASGLYGPGRAAAAIVGHANLNLGERVAPVLEALQAASPNRFRGIRHSVTWDPHPEVENTAAHRMEGQLASDQFRAGARVLARHGIVPRRVAVLPAAARAGGLCQGRPRPDHHPEPYWRPDAGRPLRQPGRRGAGHLAARHRGRGGLPQRLRQARGHRHAPHWVSTGMHGNKPIGSEELAAAMAPFMTYCIEQFGPNRCMFESNFPVDKVSFSLPRDVQRLQTALQGLLGCRARRDVP